MISFPITSAVHPPSAPLTAEVLLHLLPDGLFVITAAEEIVELGNCGLDGHIAAADRVCPGQAAAGLIGTQTYRALLALGADHYIHDFTEFDYGWLEN